MTRVDAGLTAEEQQIFQDWLASDSRHADAFDRFTETWSVFDRVQEQGATSAILDELARRTRRRKVRRLQVVAAAAVLICAGLFWVRFRAPDAAQLPIAGQMAFNDRVSRLPDGSVVELKAGAEIAVHYETDARRVTLVKGEAFFRVAKDTARPFYVESHGIMVRAVGTAFSVQARPTAIDVVVKEGAVDVGRAMASSSDSDPIRVGAGQKITMALRLLPAMRQPAPAQTPESGAETIVAKPAVENMTETEVDAQLAWRETLQEFNGITLKEAAAMLNRQNFTQIIIRNPSVGRLRVTGYFRSDNPEAFVRIVAESFNLKAEEQGDHTLLLRTHR